MSDLYNVGARIVTMAAAHNTIRALLGDGAELPHDEYARVQLLTEEAARSLVRAALEANDDFFNLKYGEFAADFPLCLDWARIACALITLEAAANDLAVRPYFFRLHYTMETGKRHAINGFLLVDGRILWLEPQGLRWLDKPVALKSYDRVRL